MSRILPILFNTEMVQAILNNNKTTTRRKIDINISNRFDVENDGKTAIVYIDQATGDRYDPKEICRYQPGDILYVRETWTYHDGAVGGIIFKARCPQKLAQIKTWHPSIHMPKKAARIWLKVTDVKVERLHNMTPDDFGAEGAIVRPEAFNDPENAYLQARSAFSAIWNATIKKADSEKYGWDANPWTWVIEFERCEKPEGV